MHDDLYFWRLLLLGICGLGQTAFVVLYLTLKWHRSPLGRALFLKGSMLAILLDLGWAANTFGFRNWDPVFVCLYAPFAVAIWWQFFVFLHIKREGSKQHGNSNDIGQTDTH